MLGNAIVAKYYFSYDLAIGQHSDHNIAVSKGVRGHCYSPTLWVFFDKLDTSRQICIANKKPVTLLPEARCHRVASISESDPTD